MAIPVINPSSIPMPDSGAGLSTASAFLNAYNSSSRLALDKERQAASLKDQETQMQWRTEDRQYEKDVLRPLEEERLKLGLVTDRLQQERQRHSLVSQRRDAEAELSTLGAMEANDQIGENLINRLTELAGTEPGDVTSDTEIADTYSQLQSLMESDAFTPAMAARAGATVAQAKFSPRLKIAQENKFIRDGLAGLRDTVATLPPNMQLSALRATGLPIKDFSASPDSMGQSMLTLSGDVSATQLSAAIDRLEGFVQSQQKASGSDSNGSTSAYTLRQIISDPNTSQAAKVQARALLEKRLAEAGGMPMTSMQGSSALLPSPDAPPPQPLSVKEMSTEALRKLTGK